MKSINSHLQPRYYLKGFLAPKTDPGHDDYLFVYKKGMPYRSDGTRKENNPVKSGLSNTAFVKNFYAFRREDGELDAETYEKKLEREIERPGKAVLDKLRSIRISKNEVFKIREVLDDNNRLVFARYVAGMFARSKKNRRWFDNAVRVTTEKFKNQSFSYPSVVSHISIEDKAELDRQLQAMNPEVDGTFTGVRLPENYLKNFEKQTLQNEAFPKMMLWTVDQFAPLLLQMKWQLRITSADQVFTGDDPVGWSDLNKTEATLIFPVSSNAIFCATNTQTIPETVFFEERDKFIAVVRDGFARHCTELYFSRQLRWLVDFFNKR